MLPKIPLVHQEDTRASAPQAQSDDLRILLGDAFHAVQKQHGQIGASQTAHGPGHAETLDTRINLATSPDPGRVYEEILRLFMADERINGVAGRAWNIADH